VSSLCGLNLFEPDEYYDLESPSEEVEDEFVANLESLAQLLLYLREYLEKYGMPEKGGGKDQEYVLREVCKDLYAGGAPIWALESGLQMAAEGLTGSKRVDFFILPRKAFIFAPSSGATSMFPITRGFDLQRLNASEAILVRMASFASNSPRALASVPRSRVPTQKDLDVACRRARQLHFEIATQDDTSAEAAADREKDELAKKILNLASDSEGLFYYINQPLKNVKPQKPGTQVQPPESNIKKGTQPDTYGTMEEKSTKNDEIHDIETQEDPVDTFWTVEEPVSELFGRLATIEAMAAIDKFDEERKVLYSRFHLMVFRFVSSAGACAFWFGGSWWDIIIAGCCGSIVGIMASLQILTREERLVFEAMASFAVGIIGALVASLRPDMFCFQAIAISGVLELLQGESMIGRACTVRVYFFVSPRLTVICDSLFLSLGFRVVYAIIELMSKQTVSGIADLFEGILFTAIISAFLQFGKAVVEAAAGRPDEAVYGCSGGINQLWYILWVPAASLGWCGLFNPEYEDLPPMVFHGILAFGVLYGFERSNMATEAQLFFAALIVTFSSGVFSRFTGRQAIGNSVAGLYVLLPGAYLVRSFFADFGETLVWFISLFFLAGAIGLGGWIGTVLCSPTIFGASKGLLQNKVKRRSTRQVTTLRASVRRDTTVRQNGTGPMLFF